MNSVINVIFVGSIVIFTLFRADIAPKTFHDEDAPKEIVTVGVDNPNN